MPKPFRFAVQSGLGSAGLQPSDWADYARLLEECGYSVMLVPDHFAPVLSPMIAAMAAAQATTRLRVGPFVVNQAWRHPAVLAKEAAALDFLSNGRLELGIGTGYVPAEQEAAGIPFEPAGVRVSRLAEYVQVVKGLLANDKFSFAGKFYTVKNLAVERPVKSAAGGHPIIVVGGNQPRLLRLAAREADVVAMTMGGGQPGQNPYEVLDEKASWVREAAGPRFDELELNLMVTGPLPVGLDKHEAARQAVERGLSGGRPGSPPYRSEDEILGSPATILGTVDQVVDALESLRARTGISYFTYFPPSNRYREYVEAFAPVVQRLTGK